MSSPTRETGRDAYSIATAMYLLQGALGLDFNEKIAAFRQFLQKRNATGGSDVSQGLDRGFANRLVGMVKVLDHLGLGESPQLAQGVVDLKSESVCLFAQRPGSANILKLRQRLDRAVDQAVI